MNDNVYSSLPFDLSGSRAKNRFRNELLWGIVYFYTLTELECAIVFDYFCDIEVYFKNRYEYYQIKTDNSNATYTVDRMIKLSKKKESILGKVYILKKYIDSYKDDKEVKSSIVSNIPLSTKSGKKYSNIDEIYFDCLDDETKKKIEDKLSEELSLKSIDFSSISFIRTHMNLEDPNDTFLSKTYEYSKALLKRDPKNLQGLCALIMNHVQNKACYEFECANYDELISKKGMTKVSLNELIIQFQGVSDETVKKLKEIIDEIYNENYRLLCKVSRAVTGIIQRIKTDLNLQNKEKLIVNYLEKNIESLNCSYLQIIDKFNRDNDIFNIEDSDEDKIVLILYVLIKFKEGYYE